MEIRNQSRDINQGDIVRITCSKKDAEVIGVYVSKQIDCHIIDIPIKNKIITRCFSLDDWEVERV